jgi:hypothetical protein
MYPDDGGLKAPVRSIEDTPSLHHVVRDHFLAGGRGGEDTISTGSGLMPPSLAFHQWAVNAVPSARPFTPDEVRRLAITPPPIRLRLIDDQTKRRRWRGWDWFDGLALGVALVSVGLVIIAHVARHDALDRLDQEQRAFKTELAGAFDCGLMLSVADEDGHAVTLPQRCNRVIDIWLGSFKGDAR